MSEWPITTLDQLGTITMGQSPESSLVSTTESGLPFLQGCAEFGARVPVAILHCSPPLRVAKQGSVLISVRAPVGTTNIADQDYCIGRGLGAVNAKQGLSSNLFLLHAIEQNVAFLHRRSQGSTFLAIGSKELAALPIPALHVAAQCRIAEILSTLDQSIEQTETLIRKYRQIKVGLMRDVFTRGVTSAGQLRPAKDEAPQMFKASPLGWIPQEWQVGHIEDYLVNPGGLKPGPFGSSLTKSFYTESGYRVYGQEQILAGSLAEGDYYISPSKWAELRDFAVASGDILMTLVGVGTVGKVLLVASPFEPGIINPRVMRLRPNTLSCHAPFLKQLIASPLVRRQFNRFATGGTMPVLNTSVVRRVRIPLVRLTEQTQITGILAAHDAAIATEEDFRQKLIRQKQGLRLKWTPSVGQKNDRP